MKIILPLQAIPQAGFAQYLVLPHVTRLIFFESWSITIVYSLLFELLATGLVLQDPDVE